jgi:hypothetical protein
MNQKPSRSINDQQSPLLVSTIPRELFTIIASFIDTESQLALAHTCKKIYNYHKEKYREETATFLCSVRRINEYSKYQYCKVLKRWLSETGWTTVEVILEEISTDSQSNNDYPIRALCSDESHELSNELKCESINALILDFSFLESSSLRSISFLEKFSNLKILRFSNIIIDKNIVPVLSKISLLIISLNYCEIIGNCLSKIFEVCATVEEIELLFNKFCTTSMMFPPQVKRLCIEGSYPFMPIDLSRCIQLRSL